jgi:hypothetical protein
MTEQNLPQIKWRAAFIGFGVDWAFSELVGLGAIMTMLVLKDIPLDSESPLPADVLLARQVVGVLGAVIGGVAAGYIARRYGSLHRVLGSLIGLFVLLCSFPVLGDVSFNIGDVGFVVLNLIGAGYGGGIGERWRARREDDD